MVWSSNEEQRIQVEKQIILGLVSIAINYLASYKYEVGEGKHIILELVLEKSRERESCAPNRRALQLIFLLLLCPVDALQLISLFPLYSTRYAL